MKVLILSCNTGGGHNSAAAAIKESFEAHGSKCDVFNALELFSKKVSQAISKGHVFVYRHLPNLFGAGYKFEENHSTKILYLASARGADELYKFIAASKYDSVIAVHVFAALTLTEIRKKYFPDIKMYFVATDYTCSPGVDMQKMDRYFIPVGLKKEFADRGMEEDRLLESGIPVRKAFYERLSKVRAKREVGLDENGKNILFMSGSMGAGPMELIAQRLLEKMAQDTTLTVVCGSNKKLYESLLPLAGERLKVCGFADNIPLLMDASDIMIGKPGGLSSSEAMVKHLPLLCFNAVPGCETRNLDFLSEKEYILRAADALDLVDKTVELLSKPEKLSEITDRLAKDFNCCSAEIIYSCVYEDYEKNDKS